MRGGNMLVGPEGPLNFFSLARSATQCWSQARKEKKVRQGTILALDGPCHNIVSGKMPPLRAFFAHNIRVMCAGLHSTRM